MPDRVATHTPRPDYGPFITPVQPPRVVPVDEETYQRGPRWRNATWLGLYAAVILTIVVHVVTNLITPYGLHRDELLYLAMGRHLQVWRMDFPPGIALAAELARGLFGDSLVAIRLPSTLAAAALVGMAYGLTRLMGGRGRSCVLTGIAMLTSPLFLRSGTLFQPVVFDQLVWTLGFVALVRLGALLDRPARVRPAAPYDPRQIPPVVPAWLLLGAACGLGLLVKFSIAFFGVAVVIAIAVVPTWRRTLLTPWPWAAFVLALAIGAPSFVGQVRLGWPMFAQMRDLQSSQLAQSGPIGFVLGQFSLGPALALAVLGLLWLLRDPAARPWRVIGWTCVAAFGLLLVGRGKAYYLGPVFPVLFAAGSVALERRIAALPLLRQRRFVRLASAAVLGLYGLVLLPFGLPLLAPSAMARYASLLGGAGTSTNTGGQLALPQDYADMLGWPEQAAAVNAVVDAMPEAKRRDVVLLAGNYGEAGALEFFGPQLALPPVVSPAGSFWFFGPGELAGNIVVAVGVNPDDLRRFFRRVRVAGTVRHALTPWVVDEERNVPIVVAEEPVQTLQEAWPSLAPR